MHFFGNGPRGPVVRAASTLSLLAFPAAISWAIVRYRLLDPPTWLQRTALNGLSALVALLFATAAVSFAFSYVERTSIVATAEVVPVALLTTLLYQAFQVGLRRVAAGRLLAEGAFERFLETASRELARCRSPEAVLDRLVDLIHRHLGASSVEWLSVKQPNRPFSSSLCARGLELWRQQGSPSHQLVWARARAEDPGPELPEVVVPLARQSGPTVVVVVASRRDGLPYTDEQRRMLESTLHVATTALEASATTGDLQARVAQKTASLEGALAERQAVVRAARAISEADQPAAVLATIRGFAAARGASVRWANLEPGTGPTVGLEVPGAGPRLLLVEGSTNDEITPQLDTLCAFAGLAIARLELLAELKREVERQAAEIAEITSTRLHAEFVRGVAHELRKPSEEVRHRVEELCAEAAPPISESLRRIRAASREMSRRLDLLLFHSGIRLDRQRIDVVHIVNDAIESVRAACPDREYRTEQELARLPMVGDPSRLASVLENLLDNAAKATDEGQVIIVRTALEPGDGQHETFVRLEVEDEGRGIPAERLEEVFEPGVAFAPSGFGLGLSLCRQIVEMHGGTIEGESRPGRTVFRIRLPQFSTGKGEGNGGDGGNPSG
jgi:signal transduction histidine kinase